MLNRWLIGEYPNAPPLFRDEDAVGPVVRLHQVCETLELQVGKCGPEGYSRQVGSTGAGVRSGLALGVGLLVGSAAVEGVRVASSVEAGERESVAIGEAVSVASAVTSAVRAGCSVPALESGSGVSAGDLQAAMRSRPRARSAAGTICLRSNG